MFPSPVGELHFSIVIIDEKIYEYEFPSPVGELHFSMNYEKTGRSGD